ncbi:glutathione S-transferas-like protein [Dothidotthia symphoricarpi CBS 119687]|uniref:Glutathione S-transferas-like protein n=1 Tax=Dothidotthia symphoricarpi CBS 119687 TaxID=1392245 RepID=A0A6A6AE44_9PLEO|nr:glutathione S-transferas-like protein [Dothidotthia symphoricarpi CBS 119687]KAF2130070.1 glutathione S-transferas-like protein [Dothidotthia symphoricarpi CBS 119687]
MVLVVHHLGLSQSERILFLCEELGIQYQMIKYNRDPILAPMSLKGHPGNLSGQAPLIEDPETGVTLSESGAICEYILAKYANTNVPRLSKQYGEEGYADYLFWLHFASASLQPLLVRALSLNVAQLPQDSSASEWAIQSVQHTLQMIDDRLRNNRWLAGEDFTAADVMTVFSLTTQRYFGPLIWLERYPHILRYLRDIGERPAYQRAMQRGDPEMQVLLGSAPPEHSILAVGGVTSDIWKKNRKGEAPMVRADSGNSTGYMADGYMDEAQQHAP